MCLLLSIGAWMPAQQTLALGSYWHSGGAEQAMPSEFPYTKQLLNSCTREILQLADYAGNCVIPLRCPVLSSTPRERYLLLIIPEMYKTRMKSCMWATKSHSQQTAALSRLPLHGAAVWIGYGHSSGDQHLLDIRAHSLSAGSSHNGANVALEKQSLPTATRSPCQDSPSSH